MQRFIVDKKRILYLLTAVVILVLIYILLGKYSRYSRSPINDKEYPMEKVSSRDGTLINFIKTGSGPPLLLVHGTTADHSRWLPLIPQFEKHFTVYAMDRRGRGGSGDSPDYHILREAEDIAAVVEAIDKPVSIIGHSYGGLCTLESALLTDKISRMILYEPPIPVDKPIYPPGVPEKMQVLIDANNFESALEIFLKEVVRMPDEELEKYSQLPVYKKRIQIVPTIPRELTIEKTYTFQPGKFADMKVPVLLLLGGDNPPIFREATELVDSALPESRIVILPGEKHIAMDTNPELFVEEVMKFLLD
jgi:pimeloyl-ACP methyl ester carboxylesterase